MTPGRLLVLSDLRISPCEVSVGVWPSARLWVTWISGAGVSGVPKQSLEETNRPLFLAKVTLTSVGSQVSSVPLSLGAEGHTGHCLSPGKDVSWSDLGVCVWAVCPALPQARLPSRKGLVEPREAAWRKGA